MGDEAPLGETSSSDVALCRQCRTPIPADAKLCRHCNSYQDWRGYLHVSSTVLALLVALVSVLSVTLPTVVNALKPGHSRIVLSNPVIRAEAVYVTASNLGGKPGMIERGLIHSRHIGMDSELEMVDPADALVGPGAKQVGFNIRLRLNPVDARLESLGVAADGLKQPRAEAGHIGLWLQGSDGVATFNKLPVSYEDVMTLLDAHAERCETAAGAPTIHNGCSGIRDLQEENDRLHRQIQEKLRGVARSPSQPKRGR